MFNRIILVLLLALLGACTKPKTWSPEDDAVTTPIDTKAYVVDTDPSTTRDPDDRVAAYLLQQAGTEPRLVSATDGNVPARRAYENAHELWDHHLVVPAARACEDKLVTYYRQALQRERLALLALGSLRNIAVVLACHPELSARITEVIVVGGRQPGEAFWLNPERKVVRPMKDLNYETNRRAMRSVIDSGVPLTFVPFAAGNAVRLQPVDLWGLPTAERNRVRDHASTLAVVGGGWTIPPFDAVAAGYLLWPNEFRCHGVRAQPGHDLILNDDSRSRHKRCVPKHPDRLRRLMLTLINKP